MQIEGDPYRPYVHVMTFIQVKVTVKTSHLDWSPPTQLNTDSSLYITQHKTVTFVLI